MKKFEQLSPEHQRVLMDIQKSVPVEWTLQVTKREDLAPATKEILAKAIEDPEVSEEFKEKARNILASKILDQKIDTEDSLVADLVDAYIEKEVAKAISLKRLPKLKKAVPFDVAIKRFNEIKNEYEKRSNQ